MRTTDFDYHLPEASIAQCPVEPRDSARLFILHRKDGSIEHKNFRDVRGLLQPGDLLVLNRTRVIPARIFARKESGGRVELLLLRRRDALTWEALVGGKGMRPGKKVILENLDTPPSLLAVQAEIVEVLEGAERLIRFSEPIEPFFPRVGNVPLPPYIHHKLDNPERYQTVYAQDAGSAAAPTAGLHFTARLLEEIQNNGVGIAYVTLHVGLDTFAPVTEEEPAAHKIHTEWCELPAETAEAINETKKKGGRVVAVGTTTVRTLESAAPKNVLQPVLPFAAPTSIFILPGYHFRVVDAMITNFHLPKSTLIMLVSAFAGRERTLDAYQLAIREGYRFYSFGDAMWID